MTEYFDTELTPEAPRPDDARPEDREVAEPAPSDLAPEVPSPAEDIPEVYYELADELAEVQGELRRASGPRSHHHPHHGPHGPHGPYDPQGPDGPRCAPDTREPYPAPRFAHGPAVPPPHPHPAAGPAVPTPPPHLAGGPAVPPPPPGEPPVPPAPPRPGEEPPRPDPFGPRDPHAPHPMERVGRGTNAVLHYLADHEGQASPGTMAADLRLSNGRISNILAALEKQGLVTREHHAEDGRKVVVKLTEAGASRAARMAHGVRGELASFLRDLGEDDARELIAILKRVMVVVKERRDRAIDAEVQGLVDDVIREA